MFITDTPAEPFDKVSLDTVEKLPTTPYGNRHILTMQDNFSKHYANSYDDWDRLLPFAMFAYNPSVHEATNFTPYELIFGCMARNPSSFSQGEELETYGSYLRDLITRITEVQKIASKNLIKAKLRSKEWYDKRARPLNAEIGDQVYVVKDDRIGKFDSRAHSPYTIVGFTANNNMILESENGERFSQHADELLVTHC